MKLNESLLEVQGVMRRNLEEMVQKGEKLESVGVKTFEMAEMAGKYRKNARDLAFWGNMREWGIWVVVVLVVLIILWWRVL